MLPPLLLFKAALFLLIFFFLSVSSNNEMEATLVRMVTNLSNISNGIF
jgi:hypothetical protein